MSRSIFFFIFLMLCVANTQARRHPLVGKWQLDKVQLVYPPRDLAADLLPRLIEIVEQSATEKIAYEFAQDGSYTSSILGENAFRGSYALKRHRLMIQQDDISAEQYRIETLAENQLVATISKENGLKVRYIFSRM